MTNSVQACQPPSGGGDDRHDGGPPSERKAGVVRRRPSAAADEGAERLVPGEAEPVEPSAPEREQYVERALRHLEGRITEQQKRDIRRQLEDRWNSDPLLKEAVRRLLAARAGDSRR